jgi:hypothetical protein
MKTKSPPVHEVRIGSIKAAIWKNESVNGIFHTVTFSRLSRDGSAWKFADGYGREDLLLLAKVADAAHSWICVHQRTEAPAESKGQE